MIFPYEVLM